MIDSAKAASNYFTHLIDGCFRMFRKPQTMGIRANWHDSCNARHISVLDKAAWGFRQRGARKAMLSIEEGNILTHCHQFCSVRAFGVRKRPSGADRIGVALGSPSWYVSAVSGWGIRISV